MADTAFADRETAPTDESISLALGAAAPVWHELFDRIHHEHPDLTESWRYYPDGKSWLMKVCSKAKTVFWLSVKRGGFQISFYFPARLTDALLASDLSEALQARLRSEPPVGTMRRASVVFGGRRGVRDVMALIALEKTLK